RRRGAYARAPARSAGRRGLRRPQGPSHTPQRARELSRLEAGSFKVAVARKELACGHGSPAFRLHFSDLEHSALAAEDEKLIAARTDDGAGVDAVARNQASA